MRHRPRLPVRFAALMGVLAFAASACGADTPAPPSAEDAPSEAPADDAVAEAQPVHVVATTSILGDIVATILGDDGTVHVIMGPGADPHTFQPSPRDGAALRDADLVVANGLDLEENLLDALDAAEQEGVRILRVADHLDPIDYAFDGLHDHGHGHGHEEEDGHGHGHEEEDGHGHGHEEEDGHGHGHEEEDDHAHDHGPEDPHVWFDPVRMADGVRLIAGEIAEVDESVDAAIWEERAEAYVAELLDVHAEIEQLVDAVSPERRLLVTNHDALGYFAHRYGFEVLGTVIPGASTQAETDPRSFAELAELVDREGVPAIFAENTDSTRLAEQLASEVVGRGDLDVEVVRIYTDALGEPGSGADTYLGLLRTTAGLIVDALT